MGATFSILCPMRSATPGMNGLGIHVNGGQASFRTAQRGVWVSGWVAMKVSPHPTQPRAVTNSSVQTSVLDSGPFRRSWQLGLRLCS